MNTDKAQTPEDKVCATTSAATAAHRSSALAWLAMLMSLAAWASLIWTNGYISLFIASLAAVAGFFGTIKVSTPVRRLAVTAIIAALVLIAVVSAFLIVIKIGLS